MEQDQLFERLSMQTTALMNKGCSLDEILHTVSASQSLLAKPYLLPKYDDPEFVVRGIWHLYAGWFDANPAHLKPPADAELAAEIVTLAGGAKKLARHAADLAAKGQTRLAVHLIEFATGALPSNKDIQAARAKVYARCIEAETSLIGKAIFAASQREAVARSNQ
jgi:alkyl sulfatase BDS1-like metallo-beta-lactamase superfamily hydrolase